MSIVQIKIDNDNNTLKYIALIRKFNAALSINTIKSAIEGQNYVISHDLYAYDVADGLIGINHTARFRQLLTDLMAVGAKLHIYCDDELCTLKYLDNRITALQEIADELQRETDRALGEVDDYLTT
ncbi:hypothetical protein [Metasolibacillus meyeri]|uniref:hypothetical protein n=1 Tax=Metasolibacillus meyeri TaxID=1071052 RepID=UPI000D31C408|nr:hypothetical protein [Metasolibacillus meyeri]